MTSATMPATPAAITTETIASAFVRSAREHASREALSDGETSLTYRELDARTNQIGRALQDRGLRPGQRLGAHLDRSLATYQIFIGALKAGLVVVPLHPGHPGEHKARMVDVAQPAVTIVDDDAQVDGICDRLPLAERRRRGAAVRRSRVAPRAWRYLCWDVLGPSDPLDGRDDPFGRWGRLARRRS